MGIRAAALAALLLAGTLTVSAQNIKGRYVSKAEADGTIYHFLPATLFENRTAGDLTFDITYKERLDGLATLNFTYFMPQATPADSVRFTSGSTVMSGPVEKLYLEPDKKAWKHRYSFRAPLTEFGAFFDENATPEVTIFSGGKSCLYRVKPSAWRSYAPIGRRIVEMIRVNESD